jgi:hypothetical protein
MHDRDARQSLSNGPAITELREDADRFIDEVRGYEPELAELLRVEERELEARELN